METLKAIFTRRSIRKYSGNVITDEQLEVLLRAAMHAPSAKNRQPWHFIVRITSYNVCYTKLLRDRDHVRRDICGNVAGLGLDDRQRGQRAAAELLADLGGRNNFV